MSIPQAQLAKQRADIGQRTAALLERYHALEVMPIGLKVEWMSLPWWTRAWRRLRGQRPDIGALVQARMEELESQLVGPCPAKKNGLPCVHHEGHDGPHQRPSFAGTKVEWTDDENDPPEDDG